MQVASRASNVRRLRRTSFRWRFPERALHVVDIENLVGAPIPTLASVTAVQGQYLACLPLRADDQVVLASSHLGLLSAGLGWPQARHLVRSGKDGADLELIGVLEHENVAARFRHVVIGSGDGGFSEAAAHLVDRGIEVTVVSRWGSLAYDLAKVAGTVIYLDRPVPVAPDNRAVPAPAANRPVPAPADNRLTVVAADRRTLIDAA